MRRYSLTSDMGVGQARGVGCGALRGGTPTGREYHTDGILRFGSVQSPPHPHIFCLSLSFRLLGRNSLQYGYIAVFRDRPWCGENRCFQVHDKQTQSDGG